MKFLFTILLAFGCNGLYAQKTGQALIDSFKNELARAKEDTNKVKILDNLSIDYCYIDPNEGIKYGEQQLALGIKLGWEKGVADANNKLGVNYFYKSDYTKSLAYSGEGLKAAEAVGYKYGMACAYGCMALVYYEENDYTQALDYNYRSLKIDEEIGNKKEVARVILTIGSIYSDQGNYPGALQSYFKALKKYEEIGNKSGIASAYANIGTVYYFLKDAPKTVAYFHKALDIYEGLGNKNKVGAMDEDISGVYSDQKDYRKAMEYHFKALAIKEEIDDKDGMARITSNISNDYTNQKNYVMAIAYGQMSLKLYQGIGNKSGEAIALVYLSAAYIALGTDKMSANTITPLSEKPGGQYLRSYSIPEDAIPAGKAARLHQGIDYLLRSLVIGKEINTPEVMLKAYRGLIDAYKLSGDYKKALESADNYYAIKDSLFSKKNNDKIAAIAYNYELDKKQDSIALLAKDNQIKVVKIKHQLWQRNTIVICSVLFVGLIVLSFLAWFQRRTKMMQVSFSRSLIQNQEVERQRISRELHDSIGQNILFIKNQLSGQSNHAAMTPVMETIAITIDEVRNISKELYPNQLEKYGLSAAVYSLAEKTNNATGIFVSADLQEIEKLLSKDAKINFFRIIQECLNNVIKHAGAKAVRITGTKTNNKIILVIMDNGKGFDTAMLERKAQGSFGILNIEERAKMLNGNMELESGTNGTKTTITIPITNEV